jgi:hypothetical protein
MQRLHVSCVPLILAVTVSVVRSDDRIDRSAAKPDEKAEILGYDLRLVGIAGQGWHDTKEAYDRLPARAEAIVRKPVWELSRHSAGLVADLKKTPDSLAAVPPMITQDHLGTARSLVP